MKIALIGYGKMGHIIERIAIERGHEVVSRIDIDNQSDFESEAFRSADVAIEFTAPKVAVENYRKAFAAGVSVVSGTTGWTERMPEVESWVKEKGLAFFWASNFSLGVNIFMAVNKYLARIMNGFADYDVSMVETHHIHKLDAPSGTAITLAEGILENLDRKSSWELGKQASAADKLPIEAIREGEVPGIHTIRYESAFDSITITHDAKNREGFALGAVLAAEYTYGKKGMLKMSDMLAF
ncbi:MAG: 4-hydroxy-tetrahydrodipicolinate reductase [Paludibacteraceae bacterium]|nr:4-hydroxy-tetrahydrodipicolinate reductase [Paludibacteraceae bacterium]